MLKCFPQLIHCLIFTHDHSADFTSVEKSVEHLWCYVHAQNIEKQILVTLLHGPRATAELIFSYKPICTALQGQLYAQIARPHPLQTVY